MRKRGIDWARDMYLVVVEVDTDSKFYLTPWPFDDFQSAIQHAIGIAQSWQCISSAPKIRIRSTEGMDELWSVEGLAAIAPLVT